MEKNEKIEAFAELLHQSAVGGGLLNVTFYAPSDRQSEALKAKGVLKSIGKQTVLQIETSMTEGRVTHDNIPIDTPEWDDRVAAYFDCFTKADLNDNDGCASILISKKRAVTLLKKGSFGVSDKRSNAGNDRAKKRLLDGSEPFLLALGISDEEGRIHDKKQPKFRQICRFAEYIAEAAAKLPDDRELYVCDLCCGKSYLSFAAYHVLTKVLGRSVRMSCVDLKKSVIDYCAETARGLGMNGMEFLCMNINDFSPAARPDMVISLHACDTATDVVLEFAVRHNAEIILSTPCCHHQMNRELNCPTLDFIAERPILRQKLCDAATDALRLLMLDAAGYKTDATELIDPEDTPKNVMLRAYKRRGWNDESEEAKGKSERYRAAYYLMYGRYPE